WAMEISFSALCQVDNPFRFTFPYSVTTKWVLVLVSVTMEPESRTGRIRDFRLPALSLKVEEQQMKLLPPLDRYAPSTKSSCPPAPLMCFTPADSAFTCPNRSIFTALLMDMKLSRADTVRTSFTYPTEALYISGLLSI